MPPELTSADKNYLPKTLFFPVSIPAIIWMRRILAILIGMMAPTLLVIVSNKIHITAGYHRFILCTIIVTTILYFAYWANVYPSLRGHVHPFEKSEGLKRRTRKPLGLYFNYLIVLPGALAMFLYLPMISLFPWATLVFNDTEVSRTFNVTEVRYNMKSGLLCKDRIRIAADGFFRKDTCINRSEIANYDRGDTVLAFGPANPMGMLIKRVEKVNP